MALFTRQGLFYARGAGRPQQNGAAAAQRRLGRALVRTQARKLGGDAAPRPRHCKQVKVRAIVIELKRSPRKPTKHRRRPATAHAQGVRFRGDCAL